VVTLADVEAMEGGQGGLQVGERFTKTFNIPGQAVYWDQGIRYTEEGARGEGSLHVDLWILQQLGMDLEHYPYALNETLRFLLRVIVPFGLLVLVSLLVVEKPSVQVQRFFIKMRIPVVVDQAEDARRVTTAQRDLGHGADTLMFPGSHWEMQRFRGVAATGFWISCGVVVLLLGLLYWLVS